MFNPCFTPLPCTVYLVNKIKWASKWVQIEPLPGRHNCAKRSIHPVVKKNWCPFCFGFVRKIIAFCERHLEGASLKILSVIWAIDFAWSENWMAVKWVSEWDRPVRGPFFGRKKVAFLRKNAKSGLWFLPLVNGAKMALFWTDVGGVTKKKVLRNDFLDAIVKASVKTLIETNHH